jgi:hypothetical protein
MQDLTPLTSPSCRSRAWHLDAVFLIAVRARLHWGLFDPELVINRPPLRRRMAQFLALAVGNPAIVQAGHGLLPHE